MSKIGQKEIPVPAGVQVELNNNVTKVKGPGGELSVEFPSTITVERNGESLVVKRSNESNDTKALHGLFRSIIANAVNGVNKNWEKRLEVIGTGFNVKLQGEDLVFKVGYSHNVTFKKVPGVKFMVEGNNKVIVSGADKQKVGEVAYQIKLIRKPDVYKGKGIRYEGERIKIKAGKKAKTA
jgi:large subunit ribosomal protein L6